MSLSCHECIAFEDSEIGFASATLAGLKTVVTLSEYNKTKIFEGALLCLTIWETKINPLKSLRVSRQIIHLSV